MNNYMIKVKEYLFNRYNHQLGIDEIKKIFNIKNKVFKIKIKNKI